MSINTRLTAVPCLFFAVIACTTTATLANLIKNPSFEDAEGGPGSVPDEWEVFNFTPQTSVQGSTDPHSGSFALESCCGTTSSGSTGAFQRVLNIVPGTEYTFGVWVKVADDNFMAGSPENQQVTVRLEWHTDPDGTSGEISRDEILFGDLLTETYQQFTIQATAPAGAGHVRPVFATRRITEAVYWDDVTLTAVLPPDTPNFGVTIDRGTGNITIENNGTGDGNLKEVRIYSATGALDPISWTSIAGNYDSTPVTGDGTVDSNGIWIRKSETNFELTENETVGDGGIILEGATVNLGDGAWVKSLSEDLVVEVTYADGSPFNPGGTDLAGVTFVGGPNDAPFERSDLNFDGDINAADWPLLRDRLFVGVGTPSPAVAYRDGKDLNGDLKTDFGDLNLFKADYDAANGLGAFEAMLASVPEPSTVILMSLGGIGLSLVRKRQAVGLCKAASLLALVAWIGTVASSTAQAATPLDLTTFTVDNYPLADGGSFMRFEPPVYTTTANSATLTVSPNPHFFYGGPSIMNKRITGTINAGADDDFVGLALGYTAGDVSNTSADFLLLDWKFNDSAQDIRDDFSSGLFYHDRTPGFDDPTPLALEGVAMSRVSGTPTGDELWAHFDYTLDNPDGGVTELQRGAARGSTGYIKNHDHVFDISYTSSQIMVKIDGTEEINITGSFPDGVLGLYSMDMNPTNGATTFSNFKLSDFDEVLTATVNTLSGTIRLTNTTSEPITLDGYALESTTSSLNYASWSSLQDQDLPGFAAGDGTGTGWEAPASSNNSALVEANRATTSVLGVGESVSLGSAFDIAKPQNVDFIYSEGNGLVSTGNVEFVSIPEDADFDDDGDVDGHDFLIWQRGFGGPGSTNMDGNADGDSDVDGTDLAIWKSQFGNGAGPISGVQIVPEPNSAVLLMLASYGLGFVKSRK